MASARRSLAASGTAAVRRAVASAVTLPSTPAARQPRWRRRITYWPSPQPASRTTPSSGSASVIRLVRGETAAIASSSSTVWPPQCSLQKSSWAAAGRPGALAREDAEEREADRDRVQLRHAASDARRLLRGDLEHAHPELES